MYVRRVSWAVVLMSSEPRVKIDEVGVKKTVSKNL